MDTSQQQSKIKFQIGHLKQTILKHATAIIAVHVTLMVFLQMVSVEP
jgi:hypothetical protein